MKVRRNVTWMMFVFVTAALGAASDRSAVTATTLPRVFPRQVNSTPLAEPPSPLVSTPAQAALTVEYQAGRLSVRATKTPLAQVLQEVSLQTGFETRGLQSLQADISVHFTGLPLLEGMRRLLASVNYILITEKSPKGDIRLTRVLVLGSGATPAPESLVGEVEGTSTEQSAMQEGQRRSLTALMAETDPSIRQWAVERFGEQGDAQAFAHLLEGLEDENPGVRQEALAGLSQYGEEALEPMKTLLQREENPEVRIAALQLVGQVGREDEDTVELLRSMVTDYDPRIRTAAVEALGYAAVPGATDALRAAAQDVDPGVRMIALRTLALYVGDDAAQATVKQRLAEDEDETVQVHASDLLETFTRQQPEEVSPNK